MNAPPSRLDAVLGHLRRAGRRISPQRLAIVRVLVESPDHPTAEAVHRRLLPEHPDMSLATVYKTIVALKECGEILELQFSGQDNRYDAKSPTPHPHCICLACGAIADPPAVGLDELTRSLARASGYAISAHRLDFYGLCPVCQAKRNK
ncbi:transcriptional repressor [Solidesulfovibrio sp.]|uniref:Fur family transcriptional regulator n=1 Tax=Solidesulfovibrio sp. TaxID=2910990 RepID=UPI0026307C46|nr:transcriptional repressor [Solidesulfovibrio sp.]